MIGTTINGEYRIQELIGEGAFGIVYRCEEIKLGRPVAIKMLRQAPLDDSGLRLFFAEARRLASLNHPNVVQIHRLGEHERSPYLVMEYLDGTSLREIVRGRRLPQAKALEIMRQVASGLFAIHSKGIIHRDLSINNIMVTGSGTAKILDFGLAKNVRSVSTITGQNQLLGTVLYVAPEQIDGKKATRASDLFSLGIILYEAVSGHHPFRASHNLAVLYNIAQKEHEPLAALLSDCPPGLSELVEQCLQKDPRKRPESALVVEQSLETLLREGRVVSGGSVPVAAIDRSLGRNPYLNRVMIRRREEFFGRKTEVSRIYSRLGGATPGSVSIVGDRRIGKSSLLNYLYSSESREAGLDQPGTMIMVFVDLQEEKGISVESFANTLITLTAEELQGAVDLSGCGAELDGLKQMVQRLDAAGLRLAILLDEFDAITTNNNFSLEFFSFLRFLANHYNVAYVTSSSQDLQSLCHTAEIADSPFFNIFTTIYLSLFSCEEAEALIEQPSAAAGRPLAPYGEELIAMAGRFPFFLQIACSHAFEFLEERGGGTLDLGEVRQRFYEEVRPHYRYLWEALDDRGRETLGWIVRKHKVPSAFGHVVGEFVRKGHVSVDGLDMHLFSSTFEDFVGSEGAKHKGRSLLDRVLGRR